MAFSGGDRTWIVYQGPPRWDGSKWVNGDRFFLSGHRALQGREGVELARGISGLELPASEMRFDTEANVPGAKLQDTIDGRRTLGAAVNILGSTASEVRENKRRWLRNHPSNEAGKLWFFTSDAMPRYLSAYKSEDAGITTLEMDPAIRRLYEELEWGWTSDDAYYRGYREVKELKTTDGKTFSRVFYNTSTVTEVFPSLYLPGSDNCRWRISRGYLQGEFVTPQIARNEEVRIDFDPENPTFLKRSLDTGELTNLWPTMTGNRPRFSLEAETMNEYTVKLESGVPSQFATAPRLAFVPMFTSWN